MGDITVVFAQVYTRGIGEIGPDVIGSEIFGGGP
jgi:hypothetical protein